MHNRHLPRFLKLLAVLFAFTVIVAACGDDDDSNASGDTDDTLQATGGDGGTTGGSADVGDVFSGDCQEAVRAFAAAQTQFATAFTGQADGAEASAEQLQAFADAAPDDIKDAFEAYVDELIPYLEAIGDLDLQGGNPGPEDMAELQELSESIDQEKLESAAEEIGAYFDEKCPSS